MRHTDVKAGQVVRFHYNKNSDGPGYRLVRVTGVDVQGINCVDLRLNAPRRFNFEHTGSHHVVAGPGEDATLPGAVLVKPEGVPVDMLLGVFKAQNPKSVDVRWDANAEVIVSRVPRDPKVKVSVLDGVLTVSYVRPDGGETSLKARTTDFGATQLPRLVHEFHLTADDMNEHVNELAGLFPDHDGECPF